MPRTHGPVISFRLPQEQHNQLLEICEEEGESPASFVKRLVVSLLEGETAPVGKPRVADEDWNPDMASGIERVPVRPNELSPHELRRRKVGGVGKGWPERVAVEGHDESGESHGSREA